MLVECFILPKNSFFSKKTLFAYENPKMTQSSSDLQFFIGKNFFNSECAFPFIGDTREKELFPNRRFSLCNLMRQSSNPKQDQFIGNINSQGR